MYDICVKGPTGNQGPFFRCEFCRAIFLCSHTILERFELTNRFSLAWSGSHPQSWLILWHIVQCAKSVRLEVAGEPQILHFLLYVIIPHLDFADPNWDIPSYVAIPGHRNLWLRLHLAQAGSFAAGLTSLHEENILRNSRSDFRTLPGQNTSSGISENLIRTWSECSQKFWLVVWNMNFIFFIYWE
jgi:hypothetical protein